MDVLCERIDLCAAPNADLLQKKNAQTFAQSASVGVAIAGKIAKN